MTETPETIHAWRIATFAEASSPCVCAMKLLEECAELLVAAKEYEEDYQEGISPGLDEQKFMLAIKVADVAIMVMAFQAIAGLHDDYWHFSGIAKGVHLECLASNILG